jgi:hypothetical protein
MRVMVASPSHPFAEPNSEPHPSRAETVAYVEDLLAELAFLAKGAQAQRLADAIEDARRVAMAERGQAD